MSIQRLCKHYGCVRYRLPNSSFCEKHQADQAELDRKMEERKQKYFESFSQSRYSDLFRTKRWRDLRAEHLRLHPVCESCGSSENLQVHHNFPRGFDYSSEELFFNPDVLETLCTSCHAKETVRRTGKEID